VATSGEGSRLDRTQEVAGSSPASSIAKGRRMRAFRFHIQDVKWRRLIVVDMPSRDRAGG